MRWLPRWGPAIAWAVVIWLFSTSGFSGFNTSRFIVPLLRWLLPRASEETLWFLHFLIRKTAHFVEYFVFSLLLLRGVRGERTGWKLAWSIAAVAMAAAYAALDELHQTFVPGRGGSPLDSLLDTFGAGTAQLLAWTRTRWQAHRQNQG